MFRFHPIFAHFILESKILKHLIKNFHFMKKHSKNAFNFAIISSLSPFDQFSSIPTPGSDFFIPTGTMSLNIDCGKQNLRNFIFWGVRTRNVQTFHWEVVHFHPILTGIQEAVAQLTKMIETIQKNTFFVCKHRFMICIPYTQKQHRVCVT